MKAAGFPVDIFLPARFRAEGSSPFRIAISALSIFVLGIVIVVVANKVERRPAWDTGRLDHVDRNMIRRALLTSASSSQFDVAAADGPPKLAFLFLIRGPLPLAPLWERFLQGHEDRYSVYIHASTPGFSVDQEVNSSWVKGRQIPGVQIVWGGPNMVRAERRLLAAGLTDPRNQRFILVSESCAPIRNFSYVHNYLLASRKSYLTSHESPWRYEARMAPLIRREQFRKGSQWFALTREHAGMVVRDTVFYNVFLETDADIPDESYIQTMLPILDPGGVVERGVEYVKWSSASARHPTVYDDKVVTPAFVRRIQESRTPPSETIGFLKMSTSRPCTLNGRPSPCFLFARKFSASSLDALLRMPHVIGY